MNKSELQSKWEGVFETMARLEAGLSQLDRQDQQFVGSVLTDFKESGIISGKQYYWMAKIANERLLVSGGKLEGDFMATVAMMLIAGESMKFPKMRFTIDEAGHEVALIFRPDRASIIVTNAYAKSNWDKHWQYGVISSRDGKLMLRAASQRRPEWPVVKEFLEALSKDPKQCAKMSAARTGRCVYCNSELTDFNSKVVGYGPTCAKNYDLPYRTDELVEAAIEMEFGL